MHCVLHYSQSNDETALCLQRACHCRVATAAGMKTAWSDKAVQYTFVAGPGDPLDLSDRITEFRPYSIDYLLNKKDIPSQVEFDLLHANAIQSWIRGNYANGTATSDGKPFNLFGSSFQVRATFSVSKSPVWVSSHLPAKENLAALQMIS